MRENARHQTGRMIGDCPASNILAGLFILVISGVLVGCDPAPDDATGAKPAVQVDAKAGLVRMTPEEITRGGIEVKPVARVDFRTFRDFPGTVVPNQHAVAEITTLVRGRVVDVYVDLGQEVKAGALLAILYSSELGLAQSGYLKAVAKLYVAERAFKRAQSLLEEKVIGLAEMQRREGEMISIRAEKRESQDRLRLLGMSDEQINRLDREQTIQSHVPIVAPFDGRIIVRNLTKGEVVETIEKLFVVADLSEVWVIANIPEKDIPYIHQDQSKHGQIIEILLTTYPDQVFHGKITYVGDVLDIGTRTMRLRIELQNPDRRLKPEMYATIRVYSAPETNVLVVPESSVQRERDRRFVFVQRDAQSFEVRDVKLGQSNGDGVKILDGLKEGETIVTQGAFVLKSELLGEQI
ncbi:MAG: efflux RND transporter periplasmic adaptor subunit [Nitrospiraceae bacterium]